MDWFQRWGISLLVILMPVVLSMAYLVPKWQSQYDNFKHIRHDNRPFGCEPLGRVSSSTELERAYEKGANTTAFVTSDGAEETHAYRCDRSLKHQLFAAIKSEPDFTMSKPYSRPPRKAAKAKGSTWVAMLGEQVTFRDVQQQYDVSAWTLKQRTEKMCKEFLQSVKGDAQVTACIPMEEYEKGHRPWWVH
jgi:hypothetical protein